MKSMIENFINGNLTEAKRQAKRFSLASIKDELIYNYSYSPNKALATATYLKGQCSFQVACDAK